MPFLKTFIFVAVLAVAGQADAAVQVELEATRVSELDALIDAAAADDAPGVAFGIVLEGRVAYERYVGLADLSHGVPVGPQTRFNIASNAKQFTALAALDLARRGALDLDADIRTVLPERLPGIDAVITSRQLLNHTSGLRDVYDLWALQDRTWWREFFRNRDALELLDAQTALNFPPGSQALYSNSNYILLAAVIEAAGGASFAEQMDALFDRLGMPDSRFKTSSFQVIDHLARPYGRWNGWSEYPSISALHADGGLYTTLRDQLRWEVLIQTAADGSDDLGLVADSQRADPVSFVSRFSNGVERRDADNGPILHHSGSTGAYNAFFLRLPEQGLAIVAMSNSGSINPRELVLQAASLLLGEDGLDGGLYPERPPTSGPRPDPASVTGTYLNEETGDLIRVVERDGDLVREIEGREPVALDPERGAVFTYRSNPNLRAAFDAGGDGPAQMTIYFAGQTPSRLVRLDEDPSAPERPGSLAGRFVSEELGVEIWITAGDKGDLIARRGEEARALRVLAPGVYQTGSYVVRFDGADAFHLSGGRLRGVRFDRRDA